MEPAHGETHKTTHQHLLPSTSKQHTLEHPSNTHQPLPTPLHHLAPANLAIELAALDALAPKPRLASVLNNATLLSPLRAAKAREHAALARATARHLLEADPALWRPTWLELRKLDPEGSGFLWHRRRGLGAMANLSDDLLRSVLRWTDLRTRAAIHCSSLALHFLSLRPLEEHEHQPQLDVHLLADGCFGATSAASTSRSRLFAHSATTAPSRRPSHRRSLSYGSSLPSPSASTVSPILAAKLQPVRPRGVIPPRSPVVASTVHGPG